MIGNQFYNRCFRFTLMALLLLGLPAVASGEESEKLALTALKTDALHASVALDIGRALDIGENLEVGQWARYKLTEKGERKEAETHLVTIGIVSLVRENDALRGAFYELSTVTETGATITLRYFKPFNETARLSRKEREMLLRIGSYQVIRLPMEAKAEKQSSGSEGRFVRIGERLRLQTKAGDFPVKHFEKRAKGKPTGAHLWFSEKALPLGIVRSVHENWEMSLEEMGADYLPAITDTAIDLP